MSLLEQGTTLEGKYEILDRLAHGGMSEVYRVRHVHLQEPRVIKVLRPDLARDANAGERFHREARTASQIKHPNVATLYDYSRLPDGTFYMVWEHIEGEDLAHRLQRRGPCPLHLALELAIQILAGLEAIHGAKVIHRDLSPDNVMLTRDADGKLKVKIIDLGLAKSVADTSAFQSQAGSFHGKLLYCSPEQAGFATEQTIDHRTDLYSFALVLYELISGRLPFDVEPHAGFVFKRFNRPALSLRGRNPEVEVPRELDRILARALQHDPAERFQDAQSFKAALVDFQLAWQPQAPPPNPTPATAGEPPSPGPAVTREPSRSDADRGPGRQLTQSERRDILSQIASSSRDIDDSTRLIGEADRALQQGHLDRAAELVQQLEAQGSKPFGLAELQRRLVEGRKKRRWMQVVQAEQMFREYVQERQRTLAEMALNTLLELEPDYPDEEALRRQLSRLDEELQERQRGEEVRRAVRDCLSRGDLQAADEKLVELEASPGQEALLEELRVEVAAHVEEHKTNVAVAAKKEEIEENLRQNRLEAAARGLEELAGYNVAKVTLDLFAQRLSAAEARNAQVTGLAEGEERYRELMAAEDWEAAREVALELENAWPESPRPAEMFAEISRRENEAGRHQALAGGARSVEEFLEKGSLDEAEVALTVLLQLDPKHPRRRKYQRQLRALRKSQK